MAQTAEIISMPPKVNTDFLKNLAREINVRLQKADDHRLAVAIKLAEAKEVCKAEGITFKSWVNREIKLKYDEAKKLSRVGASDDPAKALADMRLKTALKVSAHRRGLRNPPLKELPAPPAQFKDQIPGRAEYVVALRAMNVFDRQKEILQLMRDVDVKMRSFGAF